MAIHIDKTDVHIVAPHATRAAIAQNLIDSASTGQPMRRHRHSARMAMTGFTVSPDSMRPYF